MTLAAPSSPSTAADPLPLPLEVRPWPDPVLDRLGHDPRDSYCETFWLPLLGPSAILLARRWASELAMHPDGFAIDPEAASRSLGLGSPAGRRSAFNRTVARLVQFRLAYREADSILLVRRRLPGLSRTQAERLPGPARAAHDAWRAAETTTPALPVMRERSRRLALSLLELGESPDEVEHHLHRLRFHPSLCSEAMAWATARHHPEGAATR